MIATLFLRTDVPLIAINSVVDVIEMVIYVHLVKIWSDYKIIYNLIIYESGKCPAPLWPVSRLNTPMSL